MPYCIMPTYTYRWINIATLYLLNPMPILLFIVITSSMASVQDMWPSLQKPFQITHHGRYFHLLPIKFCNNILMSHAANSSLLCFSGSWFFRCVRHTWVPSWLQMALVAVHKQTLGCKLPYNYLSIDFATFCDTWNTNGPLLGPFQSISYYMCLARLPNTSNQPHHRDHLWCWWKNYLKWQAIWLAIHWVVGKLKYHE